MKNTIKYVEFSFENCEVGRLPIKAVSAVELNNISRDFMFIRQTEKEPLTTIDSLSCTSGFIVLDKKQAAEYGTNFSKLNKEDNKGSKGKRHYPENLAERIAAYPDIVSLSFIYQDGKMKEIYVPYKERGREIEDSDNTLEQIKTIPYRGINNDFKGHDMLAVKFLPDKDQDRLPSFDELS